MADPRDDRAVSEATAMAILVGFTVLVTASVGISVLVLDAGDGSTVSANFSFDYRSGDAMMLLSHERGDEIPAGELVIEGEPGAVTWAELAGTGPNETVGPGDLVQLSDASAWGAPVSRGDRVEIYHVTDAGNRTLLDAWEG